MYIEVVGAGSWGLALARVLARNGHRVRLWCRDEDGPDQLRATRTSPVYLPGVKLPESITWQKIRISSNGFIVMPLVDSQALYSDFSPFYHPTA